MAERVGIGVAQFLTIAGKRVVDMLAIERSGFERMIADTTTQETAVALPSDRRRSNSA